MITIVGGKWVEQVNQTWNLPQKLHPLIRYYEDDKSLFDFLLKHPLVNIPKDKCPGFIFGKFANENGPRNTELNLEEFNDNWITFDIDNPKPLEALVTIEDFTKMFEGYEYYLYTTTSHLKTPGVPKFRAFVKTKLPEFTIEDRFLFKEYMESLFTFVDDASGFELNRIFYLPNKNTEMNNYKYIINEGIPYPIDIQRFKIWLISKKRDEKLNKFIMDTKKIKSKMFKHDQINTFETWIKCNKSGCVKDFLDNYSSSNYVSGGENMLYQVLCSAHALDVSEDLIDELHTIQKHWDNPAHNTSARWNHCYTKSKRGN